MRTAAAVAAAAAAALVGAQAAQEGRSALEAADDAAAKSAGLAMNGSVVKLPRCRGLNDILFVRPVSEEQLSFPYPFGGEAYSLESPSGDCVHEILEREERIAECLPDKWIISFGGSNGHTFNHAWAQHLLGPIGQDKYYPEDYTYVDGGGDDEYAGTEERRRLQEETFDDFYSRWEAPIEFAFDPAVPGMQPVCAGRGECQKVKSPTGLTYFSGNHRQLVHLLIPEMEEYRGQGLHLPENRPSPTIFIAHGRWQQGCKAGEPFAACEPLNQRVKDNGMTYEEAVADELEEFLSYLRDYWPRIDSIFMDSRIFFKDFPKQFTPEYSAEKGYPVINWFSTGNMRFESDIRPVMVHDDHYYARHAMLRANWYMNAMCPDLQPGPYQKPMLVFDPYCTPPPAKADGEVLRVYEEESLRTCPFEVVGRGYAYSDDSEGAAAKTLYADLQGNATLDNEDQVSATSFRYPLGSYRVALMLITTAILAISAVNYFFGARLDATLRLSKIGAVLYIPFAPCVAGLEKLCNTACMKGSPSTSQAITAPKPATDARQAAPRPQSLGSNAESEADAAPVDPIMPDERDPEAATATASNTATASGAAAAGAAAAGAAAPRKSKKLLALGMSRFIASVHIVLGHMYLRDVNPAKGNQNDFAFPLWHTHGFGFTWVPYFMMLSGFVLTYARLNSRDPDKTERVTLFVWKRLRGIYPLYLCGLLARALQMSALYQRDLTLGTPGQTVMSLLLLQSWSPYVTERVYQLHCWFLSCIVPYWALHQIMYRFFRQRSTTFLWTYTFLAAAIPVALLAIVPTAMDLGLGWYSSHSTGKTSTSIDLWVVVLKFHPVSYFHIYCMGIVAAIIMHRMRESPPLLFRGGAVIGYVVLFGLFIMSKWAPVPGYKLMYRLGLLAPFQALLLIGLSLGEDPIARLFSLKVMQPFENLSYPQYVFQYIAFDLWRTWAGWGFWSVLLALSTLGYFFVQSPLKVSSKPFAKQLGGTIMIFVLPALIYLVTLAGGDALRQHFKSSDAGGGSVVLPDVVEFASGSVDQRISTVVQSSVSLEPNEEMPTLINPSLMWLSDKQEMWLAVRKHRYSVNTAQKDRDEIMWESDVFVGRVDPDTFEPLEELTSPYAAKTFWSPCQETEFEHVGANNTNFRFVTTGPEDPRLFLHGGKLHMSTNIASPVPIETPNAKCRLGRRMLFAPVAADDEPMVAARLLQDPELVVDSTEKNWLAFEHNDKLMFVRSIVPFTIVSVEEEDEEEETRIGTQIESSVYDSTLVRAFLEGHADFHGGANPIKYERALDGETRYLGVFHTKSRQNGRYVNFFFEFALEDDGVWRVDRVSSAIPVLEAPVMEGFGVSQAMTFLSGLTAVDGGVLIGYGSSNQEARVRKLSWELVEALLDQKA